MPESLFRAELKRRYRLAAIEHMAGVCKTSLTSTAIRCTELAKDAVAVVISTGQTVDYCFLSEAMKTLPQLNWIKKGTPVPSSTETAKFNANTERIRSGERRYFEVDVRDWLGGVRQETVTEEIVDLGRYGKTLTILSSQSIGQTAAGYDEGDDEEELNESWSPRFRK